MTKKAKYAGHEALDPFFEVIQKGLEGLVQGEHFYDTVAENAVFEFLYEFPGWPKMLRGRAGVVDGFSGYGTTSAFTLRAGSSFTARRIHGS